MAFGLFKRKKKEVRIEVGSFKKEGKSQSMKSQGITDRLNTEIAGKSIEEILAFVVKE